MENYSPSTWVLVLSISFLLAGCSASKKEFGYLDSKVAPGAVTVDILEGGQPEHYWQYEVRAADGTARLIDEKTFPDYKHEDIDYSVEQETGAINGCARNPEAISPDGKYVAYCNGKEWEFGVKDRASGALIFRWAAGTNTSGRSIWGFVWAPNSKSIAVLDATGHLGIMPRDLLSFASGHPVPHDTIYLDFIDIDMGRRIELPIRRDVISPQIVRILKWRQ